ncbi:MULTISPECIES: hypothetical protein [unclassified Mesorhizobium]|uniref:hypothetical protein n=1 Tax=unclassified Mesorhizobium TaxID=325217 RepID=UPI000FCA24C6|nr:MULTISPECIES: hypothetical protein [unclassified Mesorhizobium]RUU86652.1 hypothetical protein EOB59_28205 [Mesorhizobium sp. M7A.F.Ca.MR.176.00.0.0]RUV37041.1 hypothetical protein EOB49_13775 [Mesorhizobium sp. M7A.F.Ca.MR.148.00.0.0]RVD15032.1 hypothetical protein EN749_17450 [Mesorhizobium sp. M7A.F.Ca.ET.027.02.1.1]RWO89407.1 MAG: hypothetical protein EOQ96_04405 [Mesorhizobium sp.]RWP04884.1 MAG: hypothetical protein EOQ97_23255 [Mesorhizobium sp.]
MTDTNQVIVFTENPERVMPRMLVLLAIAMFLGLGALFQTDKPMPIRVGTGILVFFLASVSLHSTVRLLRGRYRAVTIGPNGFQCNEIAPQFVPWSAVTSMSEVPISFRGRYQFSVVEVRIEESSWKDLSLTKAAKLNKFQTGSMWIPSVGAETSFESFFATVKSYASAHGVD